MNTTKTKLHIKNVNVSHIEFWEELEKVAGGIPWSIKGDTFTLTVDENIECKIKELQSHFKSKQKTIIISK